MKANVIYPGDEKGQAAQVFEAETRSVDVDVALEELFRRFNCVSGNPEEEDCVRLRCRSMSVGDLVRFPDLGKTFVVRGIGWDEVTEAEVEKLLGMDFAERVIGGMRGGDRGARELT